LPWAFTPTTFADCGAGSGSLPDPTLQASADPGTAAANQLLADTCRLTLENGGAGQENKAATGDPDITSTGHLLPIAGVGSSGGGAGGAGGDGRGRGIYQVGGTLSVGPGTTVSPNAVTAGAGAASGNGGARHAGADGRAGPAGLAQGPDSFP
jgi:hypothetical protein